MKPIFESQELVRRFNEEEAIWQSFEQKRRLRKRFTSDSRISVEILDRLDWLESEREVRGVRYVGSALPRIDSSPPCRS